ncbi:efflux RND transporter permease subunit [Paenibacillus abyssi]|uniref:Swarming motility protein SwrC n=1 Tax=Paenibacillus abyssi TaxID=1340531 RepID=A0A917G6L6_9BACL|nr:efflux RND transporter permease subunit [Paenibacillus abyssi]GGG25499.1 swarming motility protein SwrC [Paenibacillus abyssi]
MKMFTSFSLRNPVAIALLVILIAVGGLYSAGKFNQEQMPDVSFPGIMVQAVYPGAAPNEVLSQVTLPLEKALRNVDGVKNVTSQSANSVSMLQLEFGYSDDMKEKNALVQEALSGIQLPAEVEKPQVMYFSTTNQPIMYTTVSPASGVSQEELTHLVKNTLLPTLQGIEGVAEVQTTGLVDDGVYIRLDAPAMSKNGVTYDQVQMALQANNLSVPLGEVTMNQSSLPVFVQGNIRSIQQLEQLIVSPGGQLTLSEIADIQQGAALNVISLTNGEPSVTLNIVKTGAANTVKVADDVLSVYDDMEKEGKLQSLMMYNRASDVKESVHTLAREGALGALFASILILFFLRNFRATIIAIVSIPLSILITLICLKYFTDVTLNIMTLGGMAVAIGRVVDDSIVVIENIVRRLQSEKISKDLIQSGTMEVGKAITSSTLTTIAVFAPLGLLQGITGEFFRPFALTVAFALLASLLVALTVVPLLAWSLMKERTPKEHAESVLSRGYKKTLRWSLNHKIIVILTASVLFIGSLVPIFAGAVGVTFLPETDYKYMFANLKMPQGTSLDAIQKEAERLDAVITKDSRVENSNITIGSGMTGSTESNTAEWFLGLSSNTDLDQFIEDMNPQLSVPEGSEFSLVKDGGGGGSIAVTVTGAAIEDIRIATEQITETVRNMPGTDNVSNNLQVGTKGIAIEVRQKDASANGLSAAQASMMLRPFLTEMKAGRIEDGMQSNDLYLALSGESLQSISDIESLKLNTPMGTQVTVKDIADVKEVQLPSAIQLKNSAEFSTVTAKITDKDVNKVNRELTAQLEKISLPAGVEYSLGGSNDDVQTMLTDMLLAMLIAVGMVYIVMVVAFQEGRAPLAVLFSLPFALIGGLVGTMVAGEPISISSLIGFLMLIGIVVTNAIVLVERVQQQIEKGHSIRDALIEAGGTRLRPILMTAIATICALIPLAIGLGGGSIISSGLAVVVIGGLASSTLLTLVVVPVMYELLYFRRSRKQMKQLQEGAAAA